MKRTTPAGRLTRYALYILLATTALPSAAQVLPSGVQKSMGDALTRTARQWIRTGRIAVDSTAMNGRTLELYANEGSAYIPFRAENVRAIYDSLRKLVPAGTGIKKIQLFADGDPVEKLIPLPLQAKPDRRGRTFTAKAGRPLITRDDVPYTPGEGLAGRHIALWQSHGYYFEQKLDRWEWQRARIFQTVEDLYTQSYVLPYLVPMLENAGACVLMPRERDTQRHEVVVDNDPGLSRSSHYAENGTWRTGDSPGFAYARETYRDTENPFRDGTFRSSATVTRESDAATACWTPDIPEQGRYAVYVSYRTLPGSADDALYTVRHRGGQTRFRVNQTMGGGTWIYLGTFRFAAGCNPEGCVTLSSLSRKRGRVVTADGVKFGGGMGNVARIMPDTMRHPQVEYDYRTSGYPRYTEAARYWLQWAGFPDSVYTSTGQTNDYKDDYMCRGYWVNSLIGGSANAPGREGLHVPVDMSLAFHTDAGTTPNDSIIGTLGIYYTRKTEGRFPNGVSRAASRDLTDLVQSQIVADIQALYEPQWSRRGMWNAAYFEAHVPEVPTMLLELLSHQNFADMRYGLDPRFRFTVSRAIYKGVLHYLSFQYRQPHVVQPLPVGGFRTAFSPDGRVQLGWRPTADPLEPTALAERYVLYTRTGDGDFDNGRIVDGCSATVEQQPGVVYSYKVTALNKGGESFPSEILSACRTPGSKGTVLVVNGFDRVSAPGSFECDSLGGFCDAVDHGVPHGEDIGYIGSQYEFDRNQAFNGNDAAGFGASRADHETEPVAGNAFDYPALHGRSIARAGYSFVSCSRSAFESGEATPDGCFAVDLILGKQRRTVMARGAKPAAFEAFPDTLQRILETYCKAGGNLFVSGAYVASDLYSSGREQDREFAAGVLRCKLRTGRAAIGGTVRGAASPFRTIGGEYAYYHEPNGESYAVESPDAIEPAGDGAWTVFRYAENGLSAGIACNAVSGVCTLGFPFESIRTDEGRDALMKGILEFFSTK